MTDLSNVTVHLLGTRGVPAAYGGFETAVEEVGARLVDKVGRVVVHTRGARSSFEYRGMKVECRPALRFKMFETLVHTMSCLGAVVRERKRSVVVLFNAGNAPALLVLRLLRIPVAVHMDGLEWKRAKWAGLGSRYYRFAEMACVRSGVPLIADAKGIGDYFRETYGVESWYIPYGCKKVIGDERQLENFDLVRRAYHLCVSRFEPENHVVEIVRGFIASSCILPLVVVGSGSYGTYESIVRSAAQDDPRVIFVGSVWDQARLDALYEGACNYIHGHSVGGTNPSLLRAIAAGAPVVAYDVSFNREVVGDGGRFFSRPDEVGDWLEKSEQASEDLFDQAEVDQDSIVRRYDWDVVADQYLALARSLVAP